MNPRYVAYCKSQGRTPEAQLKHDREAWPGGCMCGFILWIAQHRRTFAALHPESMVGENIYDQNKFTKYLQTI